MNNKQRIDRVLSRQACDRVPWFGDMDYWYGASRRAGTLPEKYLGDGYFQLNRDLDLGFYLQGFGPYRETHDGITFDTHEENGRIINTMHTPKGDLTEELQYLPTSSSYGYVKHYVNDIDDLPAFRCYIESLQYIPAYDEIHRRRNIIGDNGGVMCYTPRSPFMQMVTTFSGIEALAYLLIDEPDETNDLLNLMRKKYDIAAKIVCDSPADFVMIPENLSSEVVGKQYYLDYLRPYEQQWTGYLKGSGKYSFIHMDGTLKGLIALVAETGFDVIEAVTPAPVGDITLEEAAALVDGRSILWGGMPGTMFTPAVTDDEFRAHTIDMLNIMKRSPAFVLGVADQVPPDGTLERVAAVAALCDEYGTY